MSDVDPGEKTAPPASAPAGPAVSEPAVSEPAVSEPASGSAPAPARPEPEPTAAAANAKEAVVERERSAVPAAPPPVPRGEIGHDGRPLVTAAMSGGTVVAADLDSGREAPVESLVNEFMDQVGNPQHPLGPFQDPQSTMIAGIEEHVGYVPGWLLALCIIAVLLAMIMWYPSGY